MGEPYRDSAEHRDFQGQVSNADPHDIPVGAAQVQVNVNCVTPGQLQVRGGLRAVTFETGS